MGKKTKRVGALISGGGTNLQAIIDACETGLIDAEMIFVGSDKPNAKGLKRAQKHGIPTFVVDYSETIKKVKDNPTALILPKNADIDQIVAKQNLIKPQMDSAFPSSADKIRLFFLTRIAAEQKLLEHMKSYPVDLLVLAGFMRNLTPYFIDQLNPDPNTPRIMNIHPALLPSFPGVDGYGDTHRYGCKIGGCTVHFIDYGEDSGPIIGQKAFVIEEKDTLDTVKAKGLKLEWELYPECIQLFAEGRLKVVRSTHVLENGQTYQRSVVKVAAPL
jgi:phosphoribosylglycinamide formyltransferase-1